MEINTVFYLCCSHCTTLCNNRLVNFSFIKFKQKILNIFKIKVITEVSLASYAILFLNCRRL